MDESPTRDGKLTEPAGQPQSSVKSMAVISLCSFAQLVVQYLLLLVLAKAFGAAQEMDAYMAAMALPTVISAVCIGSLGYALVPVLSERQEAAGPDAAGETAGQLGLILLAAAAAMAAIGTLAARPVVAALHPGFSGMQVERTAALFRILSWLVVTNSLVGYAQALHHFHRRFATPALAGVLGTFVTLVIVVLLHERWGIAVVAWSVVIGSGINGAMQLPLLVRHVRVRFGELAGVRRCVRLMLPLILGAVYYRLDPLVDRYLASSMPTGSIAHLGYAGRVINALLLMGTSSLSVVAFPTIAAHSAARRSEALRGEIAYAHRLLGFILVPMTLGLVCFAGPVIHDLFERGEFTASDTQAVSLLVMLYVGMMLGASLGELSARIFYASHDTRTPVLIGAAGFTLGVILKLALAPVWGVAGVVAATSIYYVLNASCMTTLLVRRLGAPILRGVGRQLIRSTGGTLCAVLIGYAIVSLGFPWCSAVAGVAGLVTYGIVMWLLGDEFAAKLYNYIAGRLRAVRRPEESGVSDPKR